MASTAAAEQALRDGDLESALKRLQEQVRANPADSKLRIFLFQLLSVLGQWDRAMTQLGVAAELDASAIPMAQMYREALNCEVLRANVFAGKRAPMIFGQPEKWLALLIESTLLGGRGEAAHASTLRDQAFEEAPASAGTIDGTPFEWIADADMRLGPVCEAVLNGRYYWLPFERLSRIDIEAPEDLRDLVWLPAHFVFTNGGESVGVIPTRYPGSEASEDSGLRLAHKTEWIEVADGVFQGLGQRMLTTDTGDKALLATREIVFAEREASPEASEDEV
jgi:type VI secretion system protein ImpE